MAYGNGGTYGQPATVTVNSGAFAEKARTSVGEDLDHNDKAMEALSQAISELESRLVPICTPEAPASVGQGSGATPAPMVSSVVASLRAQGYRIDAATQRILALCHRIEL